MMATKLLMFGHERWRLALTVAGLGAKGAVRMLELTAFMVG